MQQEVRYSEIVFQTAGRGDWLYQRLNEYIDPLSDPRETCTLVDLMVMSVSKLVSAQLHRMLRSPLHTLKLPWSLDYR